VNQTETIIEIAIYNPTTVRQNSRQLKSVTEAGVRLEKDLDSELIPVAFNHLVNLILENCSGQISSQIFDHYPNPSKLPEIEFDLKLPSQISGIDIPTDFAVDCLTRLGCKMSSLITPPSIRKDITITADLTEEVIRFWGYQKIPTNQPLALKEITDITPREIYLIEKLKDQLIEMGYDEVLTWPLATSPVDPKTVIETQNSINSEAIYLRQSLIPSLEQQLDQYNRYKLPNPQFFEIGKIFYQQNDQFIEKNALCLYNSNYDNLARDARSCVSSDNQIIFKNNFAEIILDDLEKPEKYIPNQQKNNACELTSQIITLDANIILDQKENNEELIKKYSNLIDPKCLWQLIITDIYQDQKTNKYRYTFQASYFNIDDKTAKSIHLKTFNLL
jgi:phenylalanyl-tRNA synthetase beta chain